MFEVFCDYLERICVDVDCLAALEALCNQAQNDPLLSDDERDDIIAEAVFVKKLRRYS